MNYIALSFSLKVTKISAHEDRALHLYDIAMADVTLGLIYTYLIFVIFLHARILSHTNSHTNIRYDDNDDEFTGWSLRNLEGLRQNCWKLEFILKFVFGDSNVLVMMIMMSEPS